MESAGGRRGRGRGKWGQSGAHQDDQRLQSCPRMVHDAPGGRLSEPGVAAAAGAERGTGQGGVAHCPASRAFSMPPGGAATVGGSAELPSA